MKRVSRRTSGRPLAGVVALYADVIPDRADDETAWETVGHMLASANARYFDALRLRYRHGLTLQEVGDRLTGGRVSRERVRQMLAKALRLLRHPARFGPLREHVGRVCAEATRPLDGQRLVASGETAAPYDTEDLRSLDLEPRLWSALHYAGVGSVSQLARQSAHWLLGQRGIGEAGLATIRRVLTRRGLQVDGRFVAPPSPDADHESIYALELSVRAFNALQAAGITTVGALLRLTILDLWKVRNSGRRTIAEIRAVLAERELVLAGDAWQACGVEFATPEIQCNRMRGHGGPHESRSEPAAVGEKANDG